MPLLIFQHSMSRSHSLGAKDMYWWLNLYNGSALLVVPKVCRHTGLRPPAPYHFYRLITEFGHCRHGLEWQRQREALMQRIQKRNSHCVNHSSWTPSPRCTGAKQILISIFIFASNLDRSAWPDWGLIGTGSLQRCLWPVLTGRAGRPTTYWQTNFRSYPYK